YVVLTGRVKVPAGRYVVPNGKDMFIVSAGRTKVIPAGSTILVLTGPEEEYWIINSDHNLWHIVLNGTTGKRQKESKINIRSLPPVSVEEQIAVQRETKVTNYFFCFRLFLRIIWLMFRHQDDAKDIWVGLSKPIWRTLEIDVKGGSSYDSRGTSAPTHSAFISVASTNSKMSYPDQSHSTTFTSASSSPTSSNVIENVLHSFVDESDLQQQITYEDFDQIGKVDLEELDIKWQMAMLSVRINRFEKKAGRKMKFNNKDAARFDKKKVKCYKCSELGHFARECTGKQLDSKARYSSFKLKELDKTEEPKALLSVDSMLNWSDHKCEEVENGAAQVYGMIAGAEEDAPGSANGNATGDVANDVSNAAAEFALMGISSQVKTCPFGCAHLYAELKKEFDNVEVQYKECYIQVQAYKSTLQTLEQQKGWYQSNQLVLEERIRILTANLKNTTNMLKYTEKLNEQAKIEKLNDKVQLEESKARFDKWKDSSKNLDKLIHSSMSSRLKFGLGFGETFGSDEVFDPSGPNIFDTTPEDVVEKPLYDWFVKAVRIHAVPPPITRTFMPPSNNPDLDDTQFTYGSKSNNYFELTMYLTTLSLVITVETTDFASCVLSVKSSSSKTNDPLAFAPSSVDFKPVSKTADQQSNSTNDDSSFSFKENVKPPRNLCNKSGINSRSLCKRKSFGSKTCFVYGSKFHLIKDYDFYEQQLELHNKPMWMAISSTKYSLIFFLEAAYVPAGKPFSAGWRNHPTSHYFHHFRRPDCYNQLYKDGGKDGYTADKNLRSGYKVYNLSSKKIEETLNLRYLEDKPNVQGLGQEWYFDLDYLTDSLGPKVHEASEMVESNSDYAEELARLQRQEHEAKDTTEEMEDISQPILILGFSLPTSYDCLNLVATVTNLAPIVAVDPVPTKRVNTIHPQSQILGDLTSPVLMKGEFEMSAMGELTFFLGLQVKQKPDGIFISQDKYVQDMLKKFDMESKVDLKSVPVRNNCKRELLLVATETCVHQQELKRINAFYSAEVKDFSIGGNEATKKTQKARLKTNITSPEDLNVKFLRSLPSEWDTHVVVWMNKPDFDTMGLDDLYNNFKIVEQKDILPENAEHQGVKTTKIGIKVAHQRSKDEMLLKKAMCANSEGKKNLRKRRGIKKGSPIIEDWVLDDEMTMSLIPKVEEENYIPTAELKRSFRGT
ncbi:ribonuclease H-like domain-containing protein, partial [Tanacetum coccineum]